MLHDSLITNSIPVHMNHVFSDNVHALSLQPFDIYYQQWSKEYLCIVGPIRLNSWSGCFRISRKCWMDVSTSYIVMYVTCSNIQLHTIVLHIVISFIFLVACHWDTLTTNPREGCLKTSNLLRNYNHLFVIHTILTLTKTHFFKIFK